MIDLYEEGGPLLALIQMIPKRDHLLIENIAVQPDQQGTGLGGRLLRHTEAVSVFELGGAQRTPMLHSPRTWNSMQSVDTENIEVEGWILPLFQVSLSLIQWVSDEGSSGR